MSNINKLGKYITALLALLILCSVVYLGFAKIFMKDSYPTLFGYGSAIVVSGSMEPTISVNDVVITKESPTYENQDVVLFDEGEYLVTHRIIQSENGEYLTKGDANNAADKWIRKNKIHGKVIFVIPRVGYIQEFFSTKVGQLSLVALFLFVLTLTIDTGGNQNRKGKKDEDSNTEDEKVQS